MISHSRIALGGGGGGGEEKEPANFNALLISLARNIVLHHTSVSIFVR